MTPGRKILAHTWALLIALCAAATLAQTPVIRDAPTQHKKTEADQRKYFVRSRDVLIDVTAFGQQKQISLTLFPDVTLRLDRISARQQNKKLIWRGKVADEPGSSATFVISGPVVVGDIRLRKGRIYSIRFLGDRIHVVRQIDARRFPPEGDPDQPKQKPRDPEADPCGTDPASDIDVMLVYTADARAAAGGNDAMESEIILAVEGANEAYLNSNIAQRLRLVHMEEVAYAESSNTTTDRDRLQNPADGFLDNVQTLRDTFAADVVGLITQDAADLCGKGFIMDPVSTAFENFGYAVINRDCANTNLTLPHEFGHIMGARHNWSIDPTDNSPFHFNHGFLKPTPTAPATPWRTIMSTTGCAACDRVPFFSNPNVNFPVGGDPTGSNTEPQPTDNAQVLNNTALTVANFRCTSPGVDNVWMKDTWNDTGGEPDAHTAGEDMWKSPYIWVRNSQDVNLTHQHDHQNPIFGQPNFIYVKLHNGGGATSGDLHVYFAEAAAGLSWPADWTEISSTPVAAFAGHSTKVVEVPWNSLPGIGHFCLLARWVSPTDPMTHPEGADIGVNVRNNNNIVWRNVNIIDLGGDPAADATFIVRNVAKTRKSYTLAIRSPRSESNAPFFKLGRVSIELDDDLMKAWKASGGTSRGLTSDGKRLIVTDSAGGALTYLVLPAGFTGKVRIHFQKRASTPKRMYHVEAVELMGGEVPIGGVSYEIHTELPGTWP